MLFSRALSKVKEVVNNSELRRNRFVLLQDRRSGQLISDWNARLNNTWFKIFGGSLHQVNADQVLFLMSGMEAWRVTQSATRLSRNVIPGLNLLQYK